MGVALWHSRAARKCGGPWRSMISKTEACDRSLGRVKKTVTISFYDLNAGWIIVIYADRYYMILPSGTDEHSCWTYGWLTYHTYGGCSIVMVVYQRVIVIDWRTTRYRISWIFPWYIIGCHRLAFSKQATLNLLGLNAPAFRRWWVYWGSTTAFKRLRGWCFESCLKIKLLGLIFQQTYVKIHICFNLERALSPGSGSSLWLISFVGHFLQPPRSLGKKKILNRI